MERILFLGLGYIGLPTAALAASRGLEVVGVDVDPAIVGKVNRGEIHIVEPAWPRRSAKPCVRPGSACARRSSLAGDVYVVDRADSVKGKH